MNRIINELEQNGIYFDWDAYSDGLLREKQGQVQIVAGELARLLHCPVWQVLNPKTVIWVFYRNQIYPKSLSIEYLKEHRQEREEYALLYRLKRLQQFLSQYGDKLKGVMDEKGRIHAQWQLYGSKTGRMSCSHPNLQTFPGEMKAYFKAEPGNCLVSGDYSQIELRVLAELSKDQNMTQCFLDGGDIHRKTASSVFGVTEEDVTEEQRTIAKRVNFGLCYGISSEGLSKLLTEKAKIPTSRKTASKMRNAFYKTYPEILAYHNQLMKAREIRSLGGQVWKDYPRTIARVNLPVQASAAEGLKEALVLLLDRAPDYVKLVNVIHDEIIIEVPEKHAKKVSKLLERCMVEGMEKLICSVPISVDIQII